MQFLRWSRLRCTALFLRKASPRISNAHLSWALLCLFVAMRCHRVACTRYSSASLFEATPLHLAVINAIPQLLVAPRICASPVHITSRHGPSVSWLFGPTPFPLITSPSTAIARHFSSIPVQSQSNLYNSHSNAHRRNSTAMLIVALPSLVMSGPFLLLTLPCLALPTLCHAPLYTSMPRPGISVHFRCFSCQSLAIPLLR